MSKLIFWSRKHWLAAGLIRCCGLLIFCLLAPQLSFACGPEAGGSTTCDDGPAVTGNTSGAQVGAGNPINIITGNKFQREVDLPALPGVLGLEIVRYYNSAYSGIHAPHRIIGRGWRLSYETEIRFSDGMLQVIQADGKRIIFDRSPTDFTLCSTLDPANGSMRISRRANGREEYHWTWANGRRLDFDSHGKLEMILAPDGQYVTLMHDLDGVLYAVIDPQGRRLDISHQGSKVGDAQGRFTQIQTIDSPVGRFRYDYGSTAPKATDLIDQRILLATLVKVHLPTAYDPSQHVPALNGLGLTVSKLSRIYHYENPQFPTHLTGISIQSVEADNSVRSQRYATFGYDSNGRAILSTHADNVGKVTLDTHAGGQTILTNSLGQETRYRYAIVGGQHRLLEVRGAGCATCGETNIRYGYDKLARLIETTRLTKDGQPWQTIKNERDQQGRIVKVSQINYEKGKPSLPQWLLRYEFGSGIAPTLIARPSVVPGRECITRITYNDQMQPLSVTESGWAPAWDAQNTAGALTRTTTYRYQIINTKSLLIEIDGPLANGNTNSPLDSDITRIEYDRLGHMVVRITAPGNRNSTIQYNAAGRIVNLVNEEGKTTSFTYSPRGQLTATTHAGLTHSTQYDVFDQVLETGSSDGKTYRASQRFGVDAAGRPVWSASALGVVESRRYDTENNLLESSTQSSAIKQTQRYSYDQFGRLLSVIDSSGASRQLGWNEQGLPSVMRDALGRATRYRYDAMGKLAAVSNSMQGSSILFSRDAMGRTESVTLANGTTTRTIKDDFGRTLATISAASGTSSNRFDAASQLIGSTDANGNRATYEYDVRGRIVRQTVFEAKLNRPVTTTWRYAGSRLIAIDHPEQAERYQYDPQGRMSAKTVIVPLADGRQLSTITRYRYDELGQLASVSLPDGSSIDYQRNGQRQVTAIERNLITTPWLRWLAPTQHIVQHLERDVIGLTSLMFGNGIEAQYQRSQEGALARIVYRTAQPTWQRTNAALDIVFGVKAAHAAQPDLPGALGLPPDPSALIDHRYLWDVHGNLLHDKGKTTVSNYAYDGQNRLIAAGTTLPATPNKASYDRYFYDTSGNRLLGQEGILDQNDSHTNTLTTHYAADSQRWQSVHDDEKFAISARYDAAGQPSNIGQHDYVWDALGKLLEVRQGEQLLARYRYNHRGERIAKFVNGTQIHYLYEDRKLVAELNSAGQITRQYVYLGEQAIAIIDTPAGKVTGGEEPTLLAQLKADLLSIYTTWCAKVETIGYLHNNHLGATEMVTNANGAVIWQTAYSPFGKLVRTGVQAKTGFQFNLRLPGQYFDQETGLYYNDHRYYDPSRGQYLTPDPLGLRGGINSYAYAGGNPLKYIDPSGLVLFAFDGTGNDESKPAELSNVVRFGDLYLGPKYYITGVGTKDEKTGIAPYWIDLGGNVDLATAYTGKKRINAMVNYLDQYSNGMADDTPFNIDIAGFSRGAAEARDFANQIIGNYSNGYYRYKNNTGPAQCQKVNFRFMGLFDTVLSTHVPWDHYQLSIPDTFEYVAQATALNEFRGNTPAFPSESILGVPASNDRTRIERQFLGAHSDIGGGFPDQDLAKIALVWMADQAKAAGLKMDKLDRTIISHPVLHDSSRNLREGAPNGGPTESSEDRDVRYADGTVVKQRKATQGLTTYTDTLRFISYKTNPLSSDNIAGTVDAKAYLDWLDDHYYNIKMTIQD